MDKVATGIEELKTTIKAQRTVLVRDWDKSLSYKFNLLPDYNKFFQIVTTQLKCSNGACLYWVPDNNIKNKFKINNQESYDNFLENIEGLNDIVIFIHNNNNKGSPTVLPKESKVITPSITSKSSVGSGRRDSASQKQFRDLLLDRDGHKCVLCSYTKNVEAAHILPISADATNLEKYNLSTFDDVQNGIILCKTCHSYFDALFWCVNKQGKVEVANALLQYPDTKGHFRRYIGQTLQLEKEHKKIWPRKDLLAYQESRYRISAMERQLVQAEYPFICNECSERYRTEASLNVHTKKCKGKQKKFNRHTDRKQAPTVSKRKMIKGDSSTTKSIHFK